MSSGAARRIALVVRQALLMICVQIEKEFNLKPTSGARIRVEIIGDDELPDDR